MTRAVNAPDEVLNPQLRLLVAPCRSGSTALLRCLAQHPDVTAYYQRVKAGLREGRGEDYSVYYRCRDLPPGGILVDKETTGPNTPAEACLRVFPEDAAFATARPVFLFRNPVQTWNGWIGQGWTHFDLFELAYLHAYTLLLRARAAAARETLCLSYERLIAEPARGVELLCRHWGLEYRPDMLDWHGGLQPGGRIHGGRDFADSLAEGRFAAVEETRTLQRLDHPWVVPQRDVDRIERGALGRVHDAITGIVGDAHVPAHGAPAPVPTMPTGGRSPSSTQERGTENTHQVER